VRRLMAYSMILVITSLTLALSTYGHGGDTDFVHSCVRNANGNVRIIGPNGSCNASETAQDWPTAAAFLALQEKLAEFQSIRDISRDLVIKNNDATPESAIDVAAAEVMLQDATGDARRVVPVVLSVDAEASGANGVDIGISEPDRWYHIWVIFDSASEKAAGLLSLDPEDPVLPLGYDYKARVGAIRTEPDSGNLIRIEQVGHRVMREPKRAILQSSQVFLTPVSIASLIPPTAKQVSGSWDTAQYATSGYGLVAATPQGLSSLAFGYVFSLDGSEGNLNTFGSYQLPLAEPQMLYLTLFNGTVDLYVSGWEF